MEIETIKKRIARLEQLQEEVRINKEMLKGELENDDIYLEIAKEVKAAVAKRKQKKDEILSHGPNQEVVKNIKEDVEEISTLKEILSAELMEFYNEKKVDELMDASGQLRKFQVLVKLLPKKGSFDA
ncbi:MAG: hypothetical protein WCG48_03790 [Candidatus Berkelbacteria bacterium]